MRIFITIHVAKDASGIISTGKIRSPICVARLQIDFVSIDHLPLILVVTVIVKVIDRVSQHYGSKQSDFETLNFTLSHELGSERSEPASKRVSAAERVSEQSRVEQANE